MLGGGGVGGMVKKWGIGQCYLFHLFGEVKLNNNYTSVYLNLNYGTV